MLKKERRDCRGSPVFLFFTRFGSVYDTKTWAYNSRTVMAAYEENVEPVEVGTKLDEPVVVGYDNHGKISEEYLPETEPSTESEPESTTDLKANRIPDNDSVIGHIFRTAGGHIPDTPENRAWLEGGRQVWAEARNGNIFEGGINDMPNPWDPATGLKRSRKESVT